MVRPLLESGVEVRADAEAQAALAGAGLNVTPAQPGDYGTEFLALTASIRTVSGLDEALDFIAEHGGHSASAAQDVVSQLKKDKRYMRDVY